jgi:hypothetical protein
VLSRQSGKERRFLYGCTVRHKRGASVCSNAVLLPMAVLNEAVLKELAVAMGDEMVWRLLNYTFDAIAPPTVAADVERLQQNLRTLDGKIANLLAAIENGGAAATLIQHLQARQTEREEPLKAIAAKEAIANVTMERDTIAAEVMEHMAEWRAWPTADNEDRRRLLREVLLTPITFTPGSGKSYRFEARLDADRLLKGRCSPKMASPASSARSWTKEIREFCAAA